MSENIYAYSNLWLNAIITVKEREESRHVLLTGFRFNVTRYHPQQRLTGPLVKKKQKKTG